MPDPTLDDVLQEAYASASPDKLMIDTMSFYYDGLVNGDGDPDELYLFNGDNPTQITEAGLPLLVARLEAGAPRSAGALVTFLGISFDITLPAMTAQAVNAAQITVDGVGREMHELLEAAAKSGKAVEATYRSYVRGNEDAGPQSLPPRKFLLSGASGANASAAARLVFFKMANRAFPNDTYRPSRFRTLQYA